VPTAHRTVRTWSTHLDTASVAVVAFDAARKQFTTTGTSHLA
jgi:hypothetical protein